MVCKSLRFLTFFVLFSGFLIKSLATETPAELLRVEIATQVEKAALGDDRLKLKLDIESIDWPKINPRIDSIIDYYKLGDRGSLYIESIKLKIRSIEKFVVPGKRTDGRGYNYLFDGNGLVDATNFENGEIVARIVISHQRKKFTYDYYLKLPKSSQSFITQYSRGIKLDCRLYAYGLRGNETRRVKYSENLITSSLRRRQNLKYSEDYLKFFNDKGLEISGKHRIELEVPSFAVEELARAKKFILKINSQYGPLVREINVNTFPLFGKREEHIFKEVFYENKKTREVYSLTCKTYVEPRRVLYRTLGEIESQDGLITYHDNYDGKYLCKGKQLVSVEDLKKFFVTQGGKIRKTKLSDVRFLYPRSAPKSEARGEIYRNKKEKFYPVHIYVPETDNFRIGFYFNNEDYTVPENFPNPTFPNGIEIPTAIWTNSTVGKYGSYRFWMKSGAFEGDWDSYVGAVVCKD